MVSVTRLSESSVGSWGRLMRGCEDEGWCSCVAWWTPTWDGFSERTAEENRQLRKYLFAHGEYDGYLAWEMDQPVGWCQVGPRDRLHKLREQFDLEPEMGTWAITCFKVRPDHRRQRVAMQMLAAVIEDLPSRGATRLEAFPKRMEGADPTALWTGPEALYTKLGFQIVKDDPRRPILALELT
ncbi:MAG: GNAT family N-acetyltransferase [Proteobacteria bacterium]|nr:GNAT family N-acetyltransferase [Pseudomonadota bacterium]